jgi:SAM-dependent MidA family methyltransferase
VSDYQTASAEIRRLIRSAGPMPVSRYMELCLSHPQFGYYMTRDPLGREGDFTTAPEVSQMFGELLGLWAAAVWKSMGMPNPVRLIELGPGRGTMMADMLRAIRVLPSFYQAVTVHLVEINPALIAKQKEALHGFRSGVTWHDSIADLPDGPPIILANEYFDALPVHQAIRQQHGWHERVIMLNEHDQLVFGVAPEPLHRFDVLLPPLVRMAPVGAIFEWRPTQEIMRLARRVQEHRGAALIVDYGHVRSDAGDTFQAISRHSFADPLRNPGQADLTAHVDFQALALGAEDANARTHGPVEQGTFLKRLGIETRASTLMGKATPQMATDIAGALRRLTGTGRGEMGALFKVLGVSHSDMTSLPGLTDIEPEAETMAGGGS